jgi:hypothetical protein
MKQIILILLFFSCYAAAFSQKRKKEKLPAVKIPNIKLAYTGNSNPGVKLGAEFMFKNKQITINNKSSTPQIRKSENFVTANLQLFQHHTFDNNIMFYAEWLKRKTYANGFFIDGSLGVGISRGINKEPVTYKRNADGKLSKVKPTVNYLAVIPSIGAGYDLSKKNGKPFMLYAKGGMQAMYYHRFGYFMITAEVGVITPLSFFKRKK